MGFKAKKVRVPVDNRDEEREAAEAASRLRARTRKAEGRKGNVKAGGAAILEAVTPRALQGAASAALG